MPPRNSEVNAGTSARESRVSKTSRTILFAQGVILGAILVGVSTKFVITQRFAASEAQCRSRLARLWLAMRLYRDDHGAFPPLCVTDANGAPVHSWRVLLLPYLGCNEWSQKYNFNEPWNSEGNMSLLRSAPTDVVENFRCPNGSSGASTTSFVALSIPGRCDGTCVNAARAQRIAIIEYPASTVSWTEPRDIPLDLVESILTRKNKLGYVNFVTCDGMVGELFDDKVVFNGSESELLQYMTR
jgi:hypothetical protein